jgi:hypothetical protein
LIVSHLLSGVKSDTDPADEKSKIESAFGGENRKSNPPSAEKIVNSYLWVELRSVRRTKLLKFSTSYLLREAEYLLPEAKYSAIRNPQSEQILQSLRSFRMTLTQVILSEAKNLLQY